MSALLATISPRLPVSAELTNITSMVLPQHFHTDDHLASTLANTWRYETENPRFLGYAASSQKTILKLAVRRERSERRRHDVARRNRNRAGRSGCLSRWM